MPSTRREARAKDVTIWYDQEGDYLEVHFERKEVYFRETESDAVMEKVDQEARVIGFSIPNVSATKSQAPLSVPLRDVTTVSLLSGEFLDVERRE